MIDDTTLPPELISAIGSEPRDFIVKAKRSQPAKVSLAILIFGAVWLGFSSIFVFLFLGPVFQGKEVHFLTNDVPTVAGPGNLKPLIGPALIIGLFVLIGIIMLLVGFRMLLKKGGYFVGTPTRLISFRNGSYRSIDWEQFSGDIEVSGNIKRGNLTLGMRSGKMVSSKNGPDRYVPDTLFISGIENVSEIEQLCRRRIKENDPTPSSAGSYIR
ncbi:MAG: hypothetical protein GYA41_12440 [Bacteroidales bacterium]|nr:hypothetical protein [Bacteroidales bacterium]